MFQAQLLMSNAGCVVYSPWFPRQGDNLRATVEVIGVSSGSLTVSVLTKNTTDTTNGTAISAVTGSFSTLGAGRAVAEFGPGSSPNGLQELVRYKFDPGVAGGWVLFRMLAPVWFDTIK